eukprot:775622-Prymnesium_polylepis.2
MAPAAKNDRGNIDKARKAALRCSAPTVRGLLQSEVSSGMHKPGSRGEPRVLKDPSAAVAFVWLRRSVAFQTALLDEVATHRAAPLSDIAARAYQLHLERHHNWILKSTFRVGLGAMPGAQVTHASLPTEPCTLGRKAPALGASPRADPPRPLKKLVQREESSLNGSAGSCGSQSATRFATQISRTWSQRKRESSMCSPRCCWTLIWTADLGFRPAVSTGLQLRACPPARHQGH